MSWSFGPRAALVVAFGAALLSGCASIRDHQGYVLDETLVTGIQPGVDNRESVAGTLGRPTFVGQFDQCDWYYIARETRQLAFNSPSPRENKVIHIRFDEAGNVERIDRTGMELVVNIDPANEETPTLGRDRSLFQELFGNIGAVGQSGRSGQTADNPQ
jgi:outer membrane protein assembly factor BamE (lipoprotein component of BamABCDE complex)